MRFLLDDEQRAFARSLDALLTAADTPAVVRAWATGDHRPGLTLWRRLADAGVFALAVPQAYGGVGPLPVETAVAFVELGRHGMPGPVVESAAAGRCWAGWAGRWPRSGWRGSRPVRQWCRWSWRGTGRTCWTGMWRTRCSP